MTVDFVSPETGRACRAELISSFAGNARLLLVENDTHQFVIPASVVTKFN